MERLMKLPGGRKAGEAAKIKVFLKSEIMLKPFVQIYELAALFY